MKTVCFINGSLRGKKASSLEFLNDVNQKLFDAEYSKTFITVRVEGGYPEDALKSIACTDVIILVFPLFSYGLPGALMRLVEDYYQYIKSGNGYNYLIKPVIPEPILIRIKNYYEKKGKMIEQNKKPQKN